MYKDFIRRTAVQQVERMEGQLQAAGMFNGLSDGQRRALLKERALNYQKSVIEVTVNNGDDTSHAIAIYQEIDKMLSGLSVGAAGTIMVWLVIIGVVAGLFWLA